MARAKEERMVRFPFSASAVGAVLSIFAASSCSAPERAPAPSANTTPPPFAEVLHEMCEGDRSDPTTIVKCIRLRDGKDAVVDCGDGVPQTVRASLGTPQVIGCGPVAGVKRIYLVESDPATTSPAAP
jgi:hypothetical protein